MIREHMMDYERAREASKNNLQMRPIAILMFTIYISSRIVYINKR
jgi:membrane-anchored protein YejM (alkaline phosphatase superfamily)